MTPEQLVAHRVRFEQTYPDTSGFTSLRQLTSDIKDHNRLVLTVAELRAYVDADRAQRAAPGVQEGEKPVAYRAWFDEDHGARWLFTLWPDEEKLEVDWQPLYAAAQPDYVPLPKTVEQARAMALVSTNWLQAHAPQELKAQTEQNKSFYNGCLRCNTPKKCGIYGCSPLTWPAETAAQPIAASNEPTKKP